MVLNGEMSMPDTGVRDDRANPTAVLPIVSPGGRPSARQRSWSACFGFWPRIAALVGLFLFAYFFVFAQVVADAVAGSRTAFLVVAPLLVALIAFGYRTAPRGVGDNESDWIFAALAGAAGFTAIALLTHRFPTLAALWRLELVGAVMWVACSAVIMFGVRHVVRMWQLWAFAFFCSTPLPFLMMIAVIGGSDAAAAALGATLGAVAAYLAGRATRSRWRLAAALGCLAVGVGLAVLLIRHTTLLVTLVVVAAILPVLVTAGLHYLTRATGNQQWAAITVRFPGRSPRSFVALALAAVVLLVLHPPVPRPQVPPLVRGDWANRGALAHVAEFPFITRFIGPGATLTRFDVPSSAAFPAAAVDVMTTANLAALRDYADAVWYPTPMPVHYRPADSGDGARTVHSNADAATDSAARDWYAVTWVWRVPGAYQQVTVIVSQVLTSDDPPPAPQPLSVSETIAGPAAWVVRQQPEYVSPVDPLVTERATEVVRLLLSAGKPTDV